MRMRRSGALMAVLVGFCLACLPSTAAAYQLIAPSGSAAGQTLNPQGLAVDRETGDLYVADTGNNRIDVFDSSGAFREAFGWGVNATAPAPELQRCTTLTGCRKGTSGDGAGQFSGPTHLDVDNDPLSPSQHALYVVDQGNFRVEKFAFEGGEFKFKLGFGSRGTAEGQFEAVFASPILLRVGPGGTVYVVDSLPGGLGGRLRYRLQRFDETGTSIPSQQILFESAAANQAAFGLAVDSTGSFYVASVEREARKFNATGTTQIGNPILGPRAGVPGNIHSLTALAIDSEDHLFVGELENEEGVQIRSIAEYDADAVLAPEPEPIRRFGYGFFGKNISDLAPYELDSGSGPEVAGLYGSEEQTVGRVQQLDFPPAGPLPLPEACTASPIGSTKATFRAKINPEGKSTTFRFEYLTQAQFEAGEYSNPETKSTGESAPIGEDFAPHSVSMQVTGLEPETIYHCRVVATNTDAPAGNPGVDGTFETGPPIEFGPAWSTEVAIDGATLHAEVNPLGTPSEGHFEYVDDASFQASGFADAQRAPASEIDYGAGEALETVSTELSGLQPGTRYHFRLFGENEFTDPTQEHGPEATFRTRSGPGGGLPDGRRFELVSPGEKNSAEAGLPGPGVAGKLAGGYIDEGNYSRIQAAAGSGEAFTFTSWTSFGSAQGAPATSQYMARRGPGGWATEDISPFGVAASFVQPPFRGFSADLSLAGVVVSEPPLTSNCQQGSENLYLRDSPTGTLRCLTVTEPVIPSGVTFCTAYAGSSADGSRVFFAANAKLTSNALAGAGFSLYEWSAADGLKLVSLLPGNTSAAPAPETGFGAKGGGCSMDGKVMRHVVSADGSRVLWTYAPGGTTRLLVRINGSETVQVDAKAGGPGQSGNGVFQAASANGSRVFFTDDSKLVSGASPGTDLYRFDLPGKSLQDLTPGSEASNVEGVLGTSHDGSHVYFVARGVLTGGEENANGEKATLNEENLYLYQEGEGLRFIAILSPEDSSSWDSAPRGLTSRVSADGRHLTFLSSRTQELAGYDNRIAEGSHCKLDGELKLANGPLCPQVFLYGADTGDLACVSCNPSGSRPVGPAVLPTWSNPFEGPRYLSEDGSRLAFDSYDRLLLGDENGKRDTYEFEVAGAGSCTAGAPTFNSTVGGCLFLISSGRSDDDSFLLDASSDGRDVFFGTRERLTGWDENENYDAYDARVGGGFAEPTQPPAPCAELGSCRPPASSPPAPASPGTSNFSGPGNPKPAKAKKKKHKKKSKRHHRKHHKKGKRGKNKKGKKGKGKAKKARSQRGAAR